jgi:hypothetical protein
MARQLFISQQTLDTWLEQEKVAFADNRMTIKSDGRSFNLIEAVRFIQVDGGEDKAGLLGKVKTVESLKGMGAERCADSVIFQEVAYKIQEGFIGEILLRSEYTLPAKPEPRALDKGPPPIPKAQPADPSVRPPDAVRTEPKLAKAPPTAAAPTAAPAKPDGKTDKPAEPSDEELLTQFLLKNL